MNQEYIQIKGTKIQGLVIKKPKNVTLKGFLIYGERPNPNNTNQITHTLVGYKEDSDFNQLEYALNKCYKEYKLKKTA